MAEQSSVFLVSDSYTAISLIILVVAIGSILWSTLRTGVPPMPSNVHVADRMLFLVPATTTGTIYELGAGWGFLALKIAGRFPAVQVIAYELSPIPFLVGKSLQLLANLFGFRRNLEIRYGNFMAAPLHDGTVIMCYLMIGAMIRLGPKLRAELPAGAIVISNAFTMPDWQPETTEIVESYQNTPIYLYRQEHPAVRLQDA